MTKTVRALLRALGVCLTGCAEPEQHHPYPSAYDWSAPPYRNCFAEVAHTDAFWIVSAQSGARVELKMGVSRLIVKFEKGETQHAIAPYGATHIMEGRPEVISCYLYPLL